MAEEQSPSAPCCNRRPPGRLLVLYYQTHGGRTSCPFRPPSVRLGFGFLLSVRAWHRLHKAAWSPFLAAAGAEEAPPVAGKPESLSRRKTRSPILFPGPRPYARMTTHRGGCRWRLQTHQPRASRRLATVICSPGPHRVRSNSSGSPQGPDGVDTRCYQTYQPRTGASRPARRGGLAGRLSIRERGNSLSGQVRTGGHPRQLVRAVPVRSLSSVT